MYPVIHLGGEVFIPSYFLSMTIAFTVALLWVAKRAPQQGLPLKVALDLSLIIMVGGFIGSRVFHILWEHPEHYMQHPWDMFKIWQGGFVFYGGVVGAFLPIIPYMRWQKQPWRPWMDLFAPVAALTYGIGRIGTFLSGSGYGHPTALPWAVVFPPGTEATANIGLHPTQLYAAFWEFLLLGVLLWLEKSRGRLKLVKPLGSLFFVLMIGHGMGRAIWEQFRDDFRGQQILDLSVSTWLSLLVVAVGVVGLLRNQQKSSNA